VLGGHEDRFARNPVHVDARARLDVVEVNKAELCDEVDDAMLLGDLHGHWEVGSGFGGEVDVDRLLRERWVGGLVVDLDNVELYNGENANYNERNLS
jgi:hypothetical protein